MSSDIVHPLKSFGFAQHCLILLLAYAVLRLERPTEVLELTNLGKYFACV